MATGHIIVLNGTSSSGKTTLVRAMQSAWPRPLLHIGLDHFINMLPFAYTASESAPPMGINSSGVWRVVYRSPATYWVPLGAR